MEATNDGAPIHEQGQDISSIGPKWPPARVSAERIKGFYTPGKIDNLEGFRSDFFYAFTDYLQSPLFGAQSDQGYSRISMRAVVSNNLVFNLPAKYREFVEAIIPLSGGNNIFENYSIVYFGANHPSRQSDNHKLQQNWENHNAAIIRQTKNPQEIIQKPINYGYQFEIVEPNDNPPGKTLTHDIFRLISRFNYDLNDTIRILTNPNFTLGVTRKDGKIVSVGLAETNQFEVEGNLLTLVELTEASTDLNHLRKGLYAGVATALLYHLADKSERRDFNGHEIDLIYGESNGSAPGVLNTARYQGRTFSTEICRDFNYQGKGILPLHVPILDPDEKSAEKEIKRNNNLFPTFISRDKLHELYS